MSETIGFSHPGRSATVNQRRIPGNPRVQFSPDRTLLRVGERVPWRLAVLILTLSKCRGQSASLASLHVLLWANQTRESRALMLAWWSGQQPIDLSTIRSDPRLDVTIGIAAAEDLVAVGSTGRIELTDRGKEFGVLIDGTAGLMEEEKSLLRNLMPINDSTVKRRMGGAHGGR